jgi:PBSX family phage terminase large subunit
VSKIENKQVIKLLPKQFQFLNSTKKEIGYVGGYGSGKSRVLAYKIIKQALIPNNLVLLTRKTLSALKDSTLRSLLMPDGNLPPVLPQGSYEYNISRNMINIYGGGTILCIGCDDPMRIMSINAGFIGIDECSELELEEYLALKGRLRCTADPIRGIAFATNPKSTNHWIYKRFYTEKDDERLLITAKTTENKYLPKDYLDDLNKLTGVNYKRYVLGEFANNEGAIYKEFNQDLHLKEEDINNYSRFIISLDIGFTDPTAILVTGYNDDKLHIFEELGTNTLTPTDIANKIIELQQIYTNNDVVIDKSAKGTITQCESMGITVIISNSDIQGGITRLKELFTKNKITISKKCVGFIKELDMYSYKDNTDKPEDKNNHFCFIAGTKIDTLSGKKNIEDITLNDLLLTRNGYKKVLNLYKDKTDDLIEVNFNNGETLIGTPNHPFIIPQNKILRMDALRYNSNVISNKAIIGEDICKMKQLDGMDHKKELNGINNTLKNKSLDLLKVLKRYVNVVEKNILINLLNNVEDFVGVIVNLKNEGKKELTILSKNVEDAKKNLQPTNMIKQHIAHVTASKNIKVKNIDVYNLEIEDYHEYFANSILVHNCDSARYMTNLYFDKRGNVISPTIYFEEDNDIEEDEED